MNFFDDLMELFGDVIKTVLAMCFGFFCLAAIFGLVMIVINIVKPNF